MKKVILAGISAILFAAASGQAQSTAFTYQGQLRSGETPANGNYDLTFGLFASASGPEQIGTIQTNSPLAILNGLFTVTLDFGSQFQGADRWLEISVRTNGGTEFATLTPRQKVTATPYALFAAGAATAGAAGSATKLTGSLSGDVTGTQAATVVAAVGGQSASNVAAGASAANAATSANTPETIVKRDASGNIAAASITGTSFAGNGAGLTQLEPANLKPGTAGINISGNAATAGEFTGTLSGEVTGPQGATVVSSVGGQTSTRIATGVSLANAATAANSAGQIVKRDEAGGFAAGAITAASVSGDGSNLTSLNASELKAGTVSDARLSGNVAQRGADQIFTGANAFVGPLSATNGNNAFGGTLTGNVIGTATTANSFSGTLSGDVAGTQGATMVVSVGGQSATAVASGSSAANAASSADTPGTLVKRDASGNFAAGAVTVASIRGSGAGLTGLNGANLVSGSVGTAQLAGGAVTSNQLAGGAALANLNASGQSGVPSGGVILSSRSNDTNLLNAGYVRLGIAALGELWQARSNPPIGARYFNTAIWTGTEAIVWGGVVDGTNYFRNGARYSPATESWTATTLTGAPEGRANHTAIWTGTEMIVWGGNSGSADTPYGNGSRYNPVTDTWTPVSNVGAPSPRLSHRAVWTGTEMLVWGGYSNSTPVAVGTGGRYNPITDTWTPISTAGAPSPRYGHAAVWTGSHLIIWGGYNNGLLNDGSRYDPISDSWSPTTSTGAPAGKNGPIFVWTGTEMIVWGGDTVIGGNQDARYNPTTDVWRALPTTGAPSSRVYSAVAWTGSEMIIWGGYAYGPVAADGARFNPDANTWTAITASGPIGRYGGSLGVWTGSELLIFGGYNFNLSPSFFNDCHSYTPPRTLSLYSKP